MTDIHRYHGAKLEVTWDKHRCTHAAVCLRRQPEVFDIHKKPWIAPDEAAADAVIETVLACPSGALRFARTDGVATEETAPDANVVAVAPAGPLYLQGDIEVTDVDGNVLFTDTRLALCRCGASERKPFCDMAHRKIEYRDAKPLAARPPVEELPAGKLTVRLAPNGPLILRGPVEVVDPAEGRLCARLEKVSLCRCGQSESKPFCDGTHNRIGFQAP